MTEKNRPVPHREGRACWKRPARPGGRTTPEPPGMTGTGPPVTAEASGGPVRGRKQGGTVECVFRIPPLMKDQGWDFYPCPLIQGGFL